MECAICLEPWVVDDRQRHAAAALRCGHVFGKRCIEAWLEQRQQCPICKANANKIDVSLLTPERIDNIPVGDLAPLVVRKKQEQAQSKQAIRRVHQTRAAVSSGVSTFAEAKRLLLATGGYLVRPGTALFPISFHRLAPTNPEHIPLALDATPHGTAFVLTLHADHSSPRLSLWKFTSFTLDPPEQLACRLTPPPGAVPADSAPSRGLPKACGIRLLKEQATVWFRGAVWQVNVATATVETECQLAAGAAPPRGGPAERVEPVATDTGCSPNLWERVALSLRRPGGDLAPALLWTRGAAAADGAGKAPPAPPPPLGRTGSGPAGTPTPPSGALLEARRSAGEVPPPVSSPENRGPNEPFPERIAAWARGAARLLLRWPGNPRPPATEVMLSDPVGAPSEVVASLPAAVDSFCVQSVPNSPSIRGRAQGDPIAFSHALGVGLLMPDGRLRDLVRRVGQPPPIIRYSVETGHLVILDAGVAKPGTVRVMVFDRESDEPRSTGVFDADFEQLTAVAAVPNRASQPTLAQRRRRGRAGGSFSPSPRPDAGAAKPVTQPATSSRSSGKRRKQSSSSSPTQPAVIDLAALSDPDSDSDIETVPVDSLSIVYSLASNPSILFVRSAWVPAAMKQTSDLPSKLISLSVSTQHVVALTETGVAWYQIE
ncbi:hypothetical protein DIPPA_12629 [Diplonema papillatum]|nr:hypothetical protein DIPPA_12629 [Diplonema papillatum]